MSDKNQKNSNLSKENKLETKQLAPKPVLVEMQTKGRPEASGVAPPKVLLQLSDEIVRRQRTSDSEPSE